MKLTFGKFRIIASDDRNLEIQEKCLVIAKIGANKNIEVEKWLFRGYHGDIRSALLRLSELQVNVGDEIPTIYEKLDSLKKWIKDNVAPAVPKLEKSGKRGRTSSSEDFELIERK